MKKLIAALFAAVVLTAGLVTVSGSPAEAYSCPKKNPYTGCTKVTAHKPHVNTKKARHKAKIKFKLNAGGLTPKGTMTLKIWHNGRLVKKVVKPYRKGLYFTTPKLGAGNWKIKIWFRAGKGTSFTKAGPKTLKFHVKRRR